MEKESLRSLLRNKVNEKLRKGHLMMALSCFMNVGLVEI